MRTVSSKTIEAAVRDMVIESNIVATDDLWNTLSLLRDREESPLARETIVQLLENLRIAKEERLPICQDTGYAVFFVERGEDVRVDGAGLAAAINAGMVAGYQDGYLRKATCNCLTRKNLGNNAPAVIHTDCVGGDGLKISFMAKGGGSENMSALAMLKPAQGWEGVRDFVVSTVDKAGANPCPPVYVGVGLGGTFEAAAVNAKRSLLRPLGESNPDPELAGMEAELLERINRLGIGAEGFGGRYTAMGVSILRLPCHIASLPVAVNIQCYASRHASVEL